MRVVFDTNVFVSGFIAPASQGERAFTLARQRRFELFTSVAILTETARVLREKFNQSALDIEAMLRLISRAAIVLKTREHLTILAGRSDNRILECGVEAHADVIVTGDRHLLALKQYEDIAIVRLPDVLRMFPDDQAGSVSAPKRRRRRG